MEFWEFLIQKEGDRSWLPLESPSTEILEGRYRIVARSSRISTSTEIRITYYATHEVPPVQRVRKRSSQTNANGLVVIVPFTRLQPGVWEVRCTSDVMAEMLGDAWQHILQLEVLPQESEVESWSDDWSGTSVESIAPPLFGSSVAPNLVRLDQTHGDLQPVFQAEASSVTPSQLENQPESRTESQPAAELSPVPFNPTVDPEQAALAGTLPLSDDDDPARPVEAPEALPAQSGSDSSTEADPVTAAMAEIWQSVEQVSQQVVDSAFSEFRDLTELEPSPSSESSLPMASPADRSIANLEPGQTFEMAAVPTIGLPMLQVVLERETLVIERGEPLLLVGRLELAAGSSPEDPTALSHPPRMTKLQVRLYDPQTSQILMDEVHSIDQCIPPFPFSGVVTLPAHYQTYLVLGEILFQGIDASGTERVLANRSFNVTTDLHELIESIANDFPTGEALPPEASLPEIAEPVPAAELDRLSLQAPAAFRRSTQAPLPPQLRPANPSRTHASLELPSFSSPFPAEPALSSELTVAEPSMRTVVEPSPAVEPNPELVPAPANVETPNVETPNIETPIEARLDNPVDPVADPLAASPEMGVLREDGIISTTAADLQLEQPSQRARESIQKSLPEIVRRSLRLAIKAPADSQVAQPSSTTESSHPLDTAPGNLDPGNLDPGDPNQLMLDPATIYDSTASDLLSPQLTPETQSREIGKRHATTESTGLIDDPADLFSAWETESPHVPWHTPPRPRPIDQSTAPEDISFRSLNLQNRFWARLQALAADSSHTLPARESHHNPTALQIRSATGLDSALTANEIVVEDDPAPVEPSGISADSLSELPPPTEPTGPLLPEDEPIPTPRLQLPTGELTASQPILVTVKLPSLEARVYVKLWLRDRQTRTMIGTPRWLIDFVPDGFGNQMARTEVVVPPGCLKVQFEAITIEIASQRESDKITLTRPVIPPDLSPLSLDGLEI